MDKIYSMEAPKAAMLTHTNLRANANQAIAWVPMLHEGGENFLSLLPFFHAFGLTFNLFCAVQKAATQVMMRSSRKSVV